jgi:DNA repair protein RadC
MVPLDDRPRERLQAHGDAHLADAELLAVILGRSSTVVAEDLLGRFADLRRMASAGVGELAATPGVGVAQACRIKAALALASRLGERPYVRGDAVGDPAEIYRRFGPRLRHLDHEVFIALALDTKNRILCEIRLAQGGSCSIDIAPRDLFTRVLREAANSVIFIHNHPSGEPAPSVHDQELTARLSAAGELVGVRVLDHVIIAAEGCRTFHEGWADRRG